MIDAEILKFLRIQWMDICEVPCFLLAFSFSDVSVILLGIVLQASMRLSYLLSPGPTGCQSLPCPLSHPLPFLLFPLCLTYLVTSHLHSRTSLGSITPASPSPPLLSPPSFLPAMLQCEAFLSCSSPWAARLYSFIPFFVHTFSIFWASTNAQSHVSAVRGGNRLGNNFSTNSEMCVFAPARF